MVEAVTGSSGKCGGAAAPNPWDALGVARTSSNAEESTEAEKSLVKASVAPMGVLVDDGIVRTGSTLTATGHTITAVIGAGVLSLPYSISVLGWVAGPIILLIFAWLTLYASQLLASCGVINGVRQRTYTDVVSTTFGRWGYICIACVQQVNLPLTVLAYQITGSISLQTVASSICSAIQTKHCFDQYWKWAIIFGAIQIVMVQLPDLSYFWWASLVGAAMSFSYSFISVALSIAEGNTHGTIAGTPMSPSAKAFGVLNATGTMMFAYAFGMILIEIQDTIKCDAKTGPIRPMRRAVNISMALMTSFYFAVAISGYMAFGNTVPSNILMAFSHPKWVVDWANIMVIIHMIPAYQVYAQPFLGFVEKYYNSWSQAPAWSRGLIFRLLLRTVFVCCICAIAIALPFFGDIIGLAGAMGYWPASVFFPIECWIRVYKPGLRKRFWLRALTISSFIVTVAAVVGSIQLIVLDSNKYKPFSD